MYQSVSQHFNLSVALHFGISIYPVAFCTSKMSISGSPRSQRASVKYPAVSQHFNLYSGGTSTSVALHFGISISPGLNPASNLSVLPFSDLLASYFVK
jgi:hypothetical protein